MMKKKSETVTDVGSKNEVQTNAAVIKREHCLDLFRGLCLLSIIFEHTCLASGESYIPFDWGKWTMLLVFRRCFLFPV